MSGAPNGKSICPNCGIISPASDPCSECSSSTFPLSLWIDLQNVSPRLDNKSRQTLYGIITRVRSEVDLAIRTNDELKCQELEKQILGKVTRRLLLPRFPCRYSNFRKCGRTCLPKTIVKDLHDNGLYNPMLYDILARYLSMPIAHVDGDHPKTTIQNLPLALSWQP